MEWLKAVSEFIKENGLVGTLLLFMVLDKAGVFAKIKRWKNPEIPHRRADDIGETHFHKRAESLQRTTELAIAKVNDVERRVESMEITLKEHLIKEAAEDIRLALLEQNQAHGREVMDELKDNQGKIFSMISQIKDHLIPGK